MAEGDAERNARAAAAMKLIRNGEADDMKILKALLPSAGRDQLYLVHEMRSDYEEKQQALLRERSESGQFRLAIDGAETIDFDGPKKA